jgi:hypothetical protein
MNICADNVGGKRLLIAFVGILTLVGCVNSQEGKNQNSEDSILNLNHLDNLGEVVTLNNQKIRLIHIYAEAPDYNWVPDDDEGASCVDDVARAAVVYLKHFELTGDEESAVKAKQLLRFILYMQTDEGLFHNFVFTNKLDKNTTHQNSVADKFNWWAARAVWALGTGANTLMEYDSSFAQTCLAAVDKALPELNKTLDSYPEQRKINNYSMPTWLIGVTGSDASSELLMGLSAAQKASSNDDYQSEINKISEGLSLMQYGDLSTPPYGAHISYEGGWHGWGNSQTMALIDAGFPESAIHEGTNFYPWLLVNGWIHSFSLDNPTNPRYFEQIAYATRTVAVGLIRLYEETGNDDFGIMAGLAASWFAGNNVAGEPMYNASHGYGYDGINDVNTINKNSGAESTIEALMTILEVEQYPIAEKWMSAKTIKTDRFKKNGNEYQYKMYQSEGEESSEKIFLVLNVSNSTYQLLREEESKQFFKN